MCPTEVGAAGPGAEQWAERATKGSRKVSSGVRDSVRVFIAEGGQRSFEYGEWRMGGARPRTSLWQSLATMPSRGPHQHRAQKWEWARSSRARPESSVRCCPLWGLNDLRRFGGWWEGNNEELREICRKDERRRWSTANAATWSWAAFGEACCWSWKLKGSSVRLLYSAQKDSYWHLKLRKNLCWKREQQANFPSKLATATIRTRVCPSCCHILRLDTNVHILSKILLLLFSSSSREESPFRAHEQPHSQPQPSSQNDNKMTE